MNIIYDQPEAVAECVGALVGYEIHPPYTGFAAVDNSGDFLGGVIFNNYTGYDVKITVAGRGCITRQSLRAVFNYCFVQLECLHISAETKRSNKVTRKLLEKLGFHCVCVLPRYFGPHRADDAFYYRMPKERAERWMENGKHS